MPLKVRHSQNVFEALIVSFPTHVIKALEKIQTSFLWINSNPVRKHKSLSKRYEYGGLKMLTYGINNSLQSSQVKILHTMIAFMSWKIISLYQLNKTFGPSFKFHSNLSFNKSSLKKFLHFYRHILIILKIDMN